MNLIKKITAAVLEDEELTDKHGAFSRIVP